MSKCKTCNGYGLWALGDESPMGEMDAGDGCPTNACPECGANVNPMKGEKRVITMWRTLDGRNIPIKDLEDDHLKNIIIHIKERTNSTNKKENSELLKIMLNEQKRRKINNNMKKFQNDIIKKENKLKKIEKDINKTKRSIIKELYKRDNIKDI